MLIPLYVGSILKERHWSEGKDVLGISSSTYFHVEIKDWVLFYYNSKFFFNLADSFHGYW